MGLVESHQRTFDDIIVNHGSKGLYNTPILRRLLVLGEWRFYYCQGADFLASSLAYFSNLNVRENWSIGHTLPVASWPEKVTKKVNDTLVWRTVLIPPGYASIHSEKICSVRAKIWRRYKTRIFECSLMVGLLLI